MVALLGPLLSVYVSQFQANVFFETSQQESCYYIEKEKCPTGQVQKKLCTLYIFVENHENSTGILYM